MGLDMYINAVDKKTNQTFPMQQRRKHYQLHDVMCQFASPDQIEDCVFAIELTEDFVKDLMINHYFSLNSEDVAFFRYLLRHIQWNTHWVDEDNRDCDYKYYYCADW